MFLRGLKIKVEQKYKTKKIKKKIKNVIMRKLRCNAIRIGPFRVVWWRWNKEIRFQFYCFTYLRQVIFNFLGKPIKMFHYEKTRI